MEIDDDGDGGITVLKSFRTDEGISQEEENDETDHCLLRIKGIPVSMANAIRRTVLSSVPVLAIDEKKIKITNTSTSPLHCEYAAHRLSLVPVSTPPPPAAAAAAAVNEDRDEYDYLQELQEATYGPPPSDVVLEKRLAFKIHITNDTGAIKEVTTDDIKVFEMGIDATKTLRGQIFKDKFLITKLKPNEEFVCDFSLSTGTATEHARWQAVNTIAYRYLIPDVDDNDSPETMTYDKVSLVQEQAWDKRGKGDPEGFMFYIEKGVLPIGTVCKTALQIIADKISAFSKFVTSKVAVADTKDKMLEFEYPNETHTVGNLIATYGLLLFPDAFVGYRITHPLENKILLRFNFKTGAAAAAAYKENIEHICQKIIEDCATLSATFD